MKNRAIYIGYWTVTVICLWALLFLGSLGQAFGGTTSVTAQEAKMLIEKYQSDTDFVILDIRTPSEYRQGHIPGAKLVDYHNPQFKKLLGRLDRSKTYLVYCRSGNRSGRALSIFSELGFKRLYHLSRGILEWQAHQLALVPASITGLF